MYPSEFYDELEKILIKSFSPLMYVNSGGCGWSAITMCKALRRVGIKADVYFREFYVTDSLLDEYGQDFVDALSIAIDNCEAWLIPNSHLMIKVGDCYFDSEGMFDPERVDVRTRTPLKLVHKILKVADWNNAFESNNTNCTFKKYQVQQSLFNSVESLKRYL
mgnify:CR=1 FL=1